MFLVCFVLSRFKSAKDTYIYFDCQTWVLTYFNSLVLELNDIS